MCFDNFYPGFIYVIYYYMTWGKTKYFFHYNKMENGNDYFSTLNALTDIVSITGALH